MLDPLDLSDHQRHEAQGDSGGEPTSDEPAGLGIDAAGVDHLVATKLARPATRRTLIARPRLLERLDEALGAPLTVVAAPAGFGKSTLVAEWARHLDASVAWLSLDAADNDPARFARYLVAAFATAQPDLAADARDALQATPGAPLEGAFTDLLNALAALPRDLVLVLDDYQVIEARPIHAALAAFLARLPPRAHLVIASRTDPPLPLARLRARGELVELRAADLSFTSTEAAAFLNDAMGLSLSEAEVATLEARAEGWIAGLQLAALSLRGRADKAEFIRAFAGSHRHVLDYLAEEVLLCLSEEDRRFLLATSILERMSADVCAALTGRADSQTVLERLERDNLFVIPLDDERVWYRYHHLFAQFLRHRLRHESPAWRPQLHQAAAAWYEARGMPSEAVEHALAGGAFARAAELIESQVAPLWARREPVTLRRWLDALPEEVVRGRPRLAAAAAETRLVLGEARGTELDPPAAEQSLAAPAGSSTPEPDSADLARLAAMRAWEAVANGEPTSALALAYQALARLPTADRLRAVALASVAIAHWLRGDVNAADRAAAEAADVAVALGHPYLAQVALVYLAQTRLLAGRLPDGLAQYQRALELTGVRANRPDVNSPYVGLGALLYERNDLEGATHNLRRSVAFAAQADNPFAVVGGLLHLGRLQLAQGDPEGAARSVERAVALAAERGLERVWIAPSVRALQVRLWLAQGNLTDAARWAAGLADRPPDRQPPVITREADELALARVRLAQNKADQAMDVLEALVEPAKRAGRVQSAIEIAILQALALQALGRSEEAVRALRRALALAAPGGFVRTFLDEAPAIVPLLQVVARGGEGQEYARRLLGALVPPGGRPVSAPPAPQRDPRMLVEPLTEREIEVLRLVAFGASNQAIADTSFIAVNTVKKHLKNAFAKLQVSNRTEAAARARDLGLL